MSSAWIAIVAITITIATDSSLMAQESAAKKEGDSTTTPKVNLPNFRFSTKSSGSKPSTAKAGTPKDAKVSMPDRGKQEILEEGALTVGLVQEQAQLPEAVRDLAKRGTAAVAVKDWDRAREIYLEMVEKVPDNALAFANLGVVEHQLENLTAAQANLMRSVSINPRIAQNWLSLGLIHYEKGDLNLAISSLTRSIHEAPDDGHARLVLAAVIRDYGWKEAAITELKRALVIDPKLADAHYNLALTYLEMDPPRLELARRHYYSAVDLGTEASPEIEKELKNVR